LIAAESAWSVTTSSSRMMRSRYLDRASGLEGILSYWENPEENGWSNIFRVSQNESVYRSSQDASTKFSNSLTYTFNRTYSTSFDTSARKAWSRMQEAQSTSASDPSDSSAFSFDDLYFSVTRSDLISVSTFLGIPASKSAIDANRLFSFSLQPSYVFENSRIRVKYTMDLTFNQIDRGFSMPVTMDRKSIPESYSLWNRVTLNVKLPKKWSWYNYLSFYQGWDMADQVDESSTFETGPSYKFNEYFKVYLTYSSEASMNSGHALFDAESESLSFSLVMSI